MPWIVSSPPQPVYSHVYAYNSIGNLESGAGKSLEYPPPGSPRPHAVISDGTYTYSYDENGNLSSKISIDTGDERSFFWDSETRLTRVENNGAFLAGFASDYEGRKVKKTFNDGSETKYVGDLYECTASGCTKYIFAGVERIAQVSANTVEYVHGDHLGSASLITAENGTLLQQITYYPYGQTRSDSNPLMGVTHRFTDQEFDLDLGLYDYGARFYDPDLMRFISADPIELPLGNPQILNRYSYTLNNPLKYIDPSGEFPVLFTVAAIAFVYDAFFTPEISNAPALEAEIVAGPTNFETGVSLLTGATFGLAATKGSLALLDEVISEVIGVPLDVTKGLVNPKTIRFSQDSIKGTFRDGRSVQDLVAGLKNGSIKPGDVPAIRTIERNGQLISIDNRRLSAFREAGVPIRTRPATAQEILQAQKQGKFSSGASGSNTIRIRGQ